MERSKHSWERMQEQNLWIRSSVETGSWTIRRSSCRAFDSGIYALTPTARTSCADHTLRTPDFLMSSGLIFFHFQRSTISTARSFICFARQETVRYKSLIHGGGATQSAFGGIRIYERSLRFLGGTVQAAKGTKSWHLFLQHRAGWTRNMRTFFARPSSGFGNFRRFHRCRIGWTVCFAFRAFGKL